MKLNNNVDKNIFNECVFIQFDSDKDQLYKQ